MTNVPTKPSQPIRQRWLDEPQASPRDVRPEQRAAELLRALKPVPRDPRAVSRLLSELVERAGKGAPARPRVAFVFRIAFAALLLGSFGGALAVVQNWDRVRELVWQAAPVAAAPAQSKHRHGSAPVVPAPALEPPEVAAPIAEPEPTRRPAGREVRAAAPAPTAAAPAAIPEAAMPVTDDSLTVETSMLDRALTALGQRRPQEALAALGAYRQRFPHGKLEYEADLAEVKAQVALGKDAPALAVLDRAIAIHGFDALPRSPDLSLLRAELLARTGDCAGAVPAFSRLLETEHPEPALQERAVYGRAVCLGKLGQRSESRKALRDYLNRFPAGRFVNEAQDALDPLQ